jgi:hypothetical protein
MKTITSSMLVALAFLAIAARSEAQTLGVQFKGGGTALTSTQEAGLVSEDNYNVVSGNDVTNAALSDASGDPTLATLTLTSTDFYSTGAGTATNDDTLVSGKIGPNYNGSASFTVSGLTAGTYDLIVYAVNDTAGQPATFSDGTTSFSFSDDTGPDFAANNQYNPATNTTATAAAAEGDTANYAEFDDLTVGAGGSITLTSTQLTPSGVGGGDFNGFQLIEQTPEPSTYALMLGGLGALVLALRMRKIG